MALKKAKKKNWFNYKNIYCLDSGGNFRNNTI